MFDPAVAAVEGALAAGAEYADARVMVSRRQHLEALNETIESLEQSESAGVGVRALIGSSWGFFATADAEEARQAGEAAAAIARASSSVPGPPLALADVPVVEAGYETPHDEDPFAVSLAEKADLIVGVTKTMQAVDGVALARAFLTAWDTEKYFVSSQGHRISQHLVECGGGMDATAVGEAETQRRSYPQSFGQYQAGGYEVIRRFDLPGHAERVASEAVALLTAPECPEATTDLVLESSQLALQIHESVGHAIELDRILGWEAAFAGTSFLELSRLGSLTYGSPLMNITADATLQGALGTFGYDDEGTPAQRVDIVKDGRWVGVLSGRDSAALAGLPPGGMVRGDGYNRLPMVRMTNVGLLPGESSLDEIIAATDDGILMATNRSWSIDDKRLNFQFGCEIAWEIRNGSLGRMLKNPTYTGITPEFWGSLDMLAGGAEWIHWGVPNCGKGQPMQTARTGHSAAPARFRGVRVGVKG
ncbi:MAG TPA: TldD/PmbA family protein [Acidimicrobiia bacterium]|nr:TldD/PmbA family protein [Acidimicrobiia bacterium]